MRPDGCNQHLIALHGEIKEAGELRPVGAVE
jgi:hypothetical protein